MLRPSPDWFVGIDSLPLRGDDLWVLPQAPLSLPPWDAGIDDGTSYTSAADPLMPTVGITTARGPPFSENATDGAAVLGTLSVSLPE